MKNPKTYSLQFKRKRKGLTNYRKRIKLLSSNNIRLVVRKSLNNISISFVRYTEKGDITELGLKSSALDKIGWKSHKGNMPSAYLLGYLAGKKAIQKGIRKAVVDIGISPSIKGSRLYAAVSGAIDAGIDIPFDKGILPSAERISGTHIAEYAELLAKSNKAKHDSHFSKYIKQNIDPVKLPELFNETKSIISQISQQKNGKEEKNIKKYT